MPTEYHSTFGAIIETPLLISRRRNPMPVVVPCHHIVARQGIGGCAGKTSGACLTIKQWLLQHESGQYGSAN